MEKTFALDRVAAGMTVGFMVMLWLPLAVFGGWDGLRRAPGDDARGLLLGLWAVGALGLAWSVRFVGARIRLRADVLVERTAFRRREVALGSIVKLERRQARRHQTLIDDLTLTLADQAPVVIDLRMVHRPNELVAELERRTRTPVTPVR